VESSSQQQADPWAEIEQAALAAFGPHINLKAPGLVAVVRRSLRYAQIDSSAREIVIDQRAFFLGLVAVGLGETPSRSRGNTATWFAYWLRTKFKLDVTRVASLEGLTGTDKLLDAFHDGCRVVVSISVNALLPRAVDYAGRTVQRTVADLRHIFAAMLDPQRSSWPEFSDFGWTPSAADISEFRRQLFDRLESDHEPGEDLDAWREILLTGATDGAGPSVRPPLGISVSGFTSDRPPERRRQPGRDREPVDDPLGIEPDVQAFARLICLEEATPPLSIGLFGGWGSGKSTFMERLEDAVADIANKEKKRQEKETAQSSKPPAPTEHRFIGNVVQIRFNAWHFADANLWASLTAEFFDQLRSGGYSRQGEQVHSRLVERVNAYVHSLSDALAASRAALAEGERRLVKAQEARDEAVKAVETAQRDLLSQTLVDAVGAAYEKHKSDLVELGHRTGQKGVTQGVDEFVKVAKDVQTVGGRLKTIARIATARGWRIALLLLAALLVLIPLALPLVSKGTELAKFFTDIGGWSFLAALVSAAGAIAPAVRIVASIVASTAKFADKLDQVSEAQLKEVLTKEAELSAAVGEAQARRQAADRAAHALVRYIDPKGTANPPRLLRFVLEDDPDTKALEKEIGIISRARRLFQAVDQIVKKERAARTKGQGSDINVPDRIVLYIDDLDRCTHAQVYAVLQAVHLLLAFELFVVVVGVDVNWVQEALESEVASYDFAGRELSKEERKAIELERRKRAIAYLEKIFQLPFWLRPLTVDGAKGGSYGQYVRKLLAANLAAKTDGPGPIFGAMETRTQSGPQGEGREKNQVAGSPPESQSNDRAAADDITALNEALSNVKLDASEVDFLASLPIGRLAAKEPRAVKRLINMYRIVRARMTDLELRELTGEDGRPPTYPILVVLAAIETGQTVEVAEAFYEGLLKSNPHDALDEHSRRTGLQDANQTMYEQPADRTFAVAISPPPHESRCRIC
jgi:hypothetical protein